MSCLGQQNREALRIVTTSWDDGEQTDLRLAEMLRLRDIKGTFYVPVTAYQGRPAITHAELRDLSSEGFEIGAHGFSHKPLWRLSKAELYKEVHPCKPYLEDVLGTEVRMFCYPRGRYDARVIRALKGAGYWGARTVQMLSVGFHFNPFEMPTTVQISPHPRFSYIKNLVRARKVGHLQTLVLNVGRLGNWLELAKWLFDSVLQNGGIWHLYGHSHEIEEMGMWTDLQEILDYVGKRRGVTYIPNCELVRPPSLGAENGES